MTLSTSGGRVLPVAEIAQQKGSSPSEVKDDSQAVPTSSPSTSNVLVPADAEEVEIAIQTEIDVVEVHEVNAEVSENALGKEAQESTEPTEDQAIEGDMVSSDTVRTLERYTKAIERIKKALELRRESWETFELSGFGSLPLGDEQDIANLQLQIDKVLESRMNASKNPTTWGKSKHILEQCFRALSPFTKNVLSVGMSAAQVPSRTLRLITRSLFSIHTGFYLEASCCSSRYIKFHQAVLMPDLGTRTCGSCGYRKDA